MSLERSRELRDQGILAQAEYDASEAAFKVAESLYKDALEEVNNRRGILAERRSDLALAEQQLADTPAARAVRGRGAAAPRQPRRVPGGRRAGADARRSLRCACGSRCPSARPRACATGQDRARSARRATTDAWPGADRPARARDRRGEPLADRRGRGREPTAALRPGSFARAEIVRPTSGGDSLVVPAPRSSPSPASRRCHGRGRQGASRSAVDDRAPRRRPGRDRSTGLAARRAVVRRARQPTAGGSRSTRRPAARPSAGDAMQKLAEICIRRPVFATMLDPRAGRGRRGQLLPARRRPLPVGRPADRQRAHDAARRVARGDRDRDLASAIEEAVNTVEGIDELRSISRPGHVDRHRHLRARPRHRRRRPGRARPRRRGRCATCRDDIDPPVDREVRQRQLAGAHDRALRPTARCAS